MRNKNIVLLHGWGASSQKLKPLEDSLKGLGWKVLNLKLPGFQAENPPTAWNLDNYVEYVASQAKTYFKNDKFVVFGHSFGGRVAIKMAYNKEKAVEAIILCSTGGLSRPGLIKRTAFLTLAKFGKILLFIKPMAKLWKKIIYKLAREHDYEKTNGVMKEVFKKVVAEDLRKYISGIKIPSLVFWGGEDRITPVSDAYFLKKNLKNTEVAIFPEAKHALPYIFYKDIAQKINLWKY